MHRTAIFILVAMLSGCISGPADPDTGESDVEAISAPGSTGNATWLPGNITERVEITYEVIIAQGIGTSRGSTGNCLMWSVPADATIRGLTVDVDADFSSGREDALVLSAIRADGSQVVEREDSEPLKPPAQVSFRDFSILQDEHFFVMFKLQGPAAQTDFTVDLALEWETRPVEAEFRTSSCAA